MTTFEWAAGLAALALAAGAVPASAEVSVIQSPSPALARGATFAWAPVPAEGFGVSDPELANEVVVDRLRAATELTLRGKGYRQVRDPAAADFLIAHTIVILPESGTGGGEGEGNRVAQGTLVLDLVETATCQLVWRATSDQRVTSRDVSQKRLAAVLRRMTKSLPR